MNIKRMDIKKIFIYGIFVVMTVIAIKAMLRMQNQIANHYDHDALITLEECLKARYQVMHESSATEYEGYEKSVSRELGLLSYDGVPFTHREIQLYIDGVSLQSAALTYYSSNPEKFDDYWYSGHVKRRDALKALLSQRLITLPDDFRAHFFISALKNDMRHALQGHVTLHWDKEKEAYYVEKELVNTTDMTLKDVRLRLSVFEDHTYTIDRWLPGETWKIRLYASRDVPDNLTVNLTMEFLNYTYGSYTYKS